MLATAAEHFPQHRRRSPEATSAHPSPDDEPAQKSVDKPDGPIVVGTPKDLRRLTTDIRRDDRDYPIIALTIGAGAEGPAFAPGAAVAAIGREGPVYVLLNDYLCRRLAAAIGDSLAVRHGAARIWWPGVTADADSAAHPVVPAQSCDDSREPVDRLVDAFELSRPRVRQLLASVEQRLLTVERQANQRLADIRESRAKHREAAGRAERAEAALATAEQKLETVRAAGVDEAELQRIASMDNEQMLHRLISREWIWALTAADRREHPLGRYVFGARFVKTVERLETTPLARVAFVCAMVASRRAKDLPGLEPHQLRGGEGGGIPQEVRRDGAKAWICKVAGPGASRLHYWVAPDGLIEFATVRTHGEIGRV